jgi:hypothetical protein
VVMDYKLCTVIIYLIFENVLNRIQDCSLFDVKVSLVKVSLISYVVMNNFNQCELD